MIKPIVVTWENDEGEEQETELPTKYEVCSGCRGEGTHVNRNIDGNGITASEWEEWHDDEKESYMNGDYDVTCETCKGARVVPVIDEEAIPLEGELRDAFNAHEEQEESEARYRYEEAMERRYCGG